MEAGGLFSFYNQEDTVALFIRTGELPPPYSLQEFAESTRSRQEQIAEEDSYHLSETLSFGSGQSEVGEFYFLEIRWQSAPRRCVWHEVEKIFLSNWYPEKPLGFVIVTSLCEGIPDYDEYEKVLDTMVDSFDEWSP